MIDSRFLEIIKAEVIISYKRSFKTQFLHNFCEEQKVLINCLPMSNECKIELTISDNANSEADAAADCKIVATAVEVPVEDQIAVSMPQSVHQNDQDGCVDVEFAGHVMNAANMFSKKCGVIKK